MYSEDRNTMFRKEYEYQSPEYEYQSPEDAYSFGRLLVYMFANWDCAWKLIFFPMPQVERFIRSLAINYDS